MQTQHSTAQTLRTLYHRCFRKNPFVYIFLTALLITSCTSAPEQTTLTVFAASSLTDAMNEIKTVFEEEHTHVEVVYQFAGSSTLSAQLLSGAQADVFASANTNQMQRVMEGDLVTSAATRYFAFNRLALITPKEATTPIESVKDLAQPGIQVVLAAPDVPVRTYTDHFLETLSTAYSADYGENFKDAVLANVVSEESNVRLVANRIALGEGDAAFVYMTDVTASIADQVEIIPMPPEANPIASYPIAYLANSASPELAEQFQSFILSEEGQAILLKWGFCVAPEDASYMLDLEEMPEFTANQIRCS